MVIATAVVPVLGVKPLVGVPVQVPSSIVSVPGPNCAGVSPAANARLETVCAPASCCTSTE
jgi:hypothetical protein